MNEAREISIPEALASINQIQQAQSSGDTMRTILGFKQLMLQAEKFEFDKEDARIKNMLKLMDEQGELGKLMSAQALDREIKKAFDADDQQRVDFLLALKSGGQRSSNVQDLTAYEKRLEAGPVSDDVANILGASRRTETTRDTRSVTQKDIEFLDTLVDQGIITEDEKRQAVLELYSIRPEDPTQTRPSAIQERIAEIDRQVSEGIITPERGNQLKQRIAAGNDPSVSSRTDANDLLTRLEKYPAFGANRQALDRLTSLMQKDKGQKVGASLDAMMAGRRFDDIPEDQKKIIASTMAYIALADPPGGEITQRFNFAQNLLKNNIPHIIEQYNKVKDKLGRLTQTKEGIYRFTGQTTDPEVATFQAMMERVVNDYVVLRSGATVTDKEFERYLRTLPSIGNTTPVNDAMMNAMKQSLQTYFESYYTTSLGPQWGAEATKSVMGNVPAINRETGPYVAPEDRAFFENARKQGYTDEEIFKYLNEKRRGQ